MFNLSKLSPRGMNGLIVYYNITVGSNVKVVSLYIFSQSKSQICVLVIGYLITNDIFICHFKG